uniref:Uncharacterized protein n=1 Tax=Lactuca sativa TaxID=4236 RepID=A0A9R1X5H9_LACSA|nr:hypothetical protein LSAT_V11C600325980 [Lactuca sativa]
MDPNQNTPPNYRNRKPYNAFVLDTTPRQFATMESPQGVVPLSNKQSSQQQQPPISQPPSSQPPLSPDLVPETQPSPPPQQKKKKGKKPARPTTTQERVPWTKEEEEKLAEAWVAASEDPILGDSQPYGSF